MQVRRATASQANMFVFYSPSIRVLPFTLVPLLRNTTTTQKRTGPPWSEPGRRTFFAFEFQQFLAEPFAAALEDQQPIGHLLLRIAKTAVKHLFDHHRQIAFERHCADAIITRTRYLHLLEDPVAAELVRRTGRVIRREVDID